MSFDEERPRIVVATDVNGTTTPHNTFAEIVRADGLFDKMQKLVRSYTSGNSSFSAALPRMRHLASAVDREGLKTYARTMPLYRGVTTTIDKLIQSENVDAKVALSTTGFAGLMALVNKFRHRSLTAVAASPVLDHLLNQEEQACLIRPITDEKEKVHVLDDLANLHGRNWHLVFHIGDTMGDFPAIKHAAELGGIGIAFKPNKPLKVSISGISKGLRARICQIDFAPDENPDYTKAGNVIEEEVWKVFKVQL